MDCARDPIGDRHCIYETDLIIEIEAGVVRRQWKIDNRAAFKHEMAR
jgi:hypothetical protein